VRSGFVSEHSNDSSSAIVLPRVLLNLFRDGHGHRSLYSSSTLEKARTSDLYRVEVVITSSGQVAIAAKWFPVYREFMSHGNLRLWPVLTVLFAGLLSLQTALPAGGEPLKIGDDTTTGKTPGSDSHPIVVELFTSEGCSSCPPADALLERMDASPPIAGAQLIVLSEHVDYWDHEGWKDPNSSAALTERQAAYVRALGLKVPYTPQMIVDGTGEIPPNQPQQSEKVFHEAAEAAKIPVSIDELSIDAQGQATIRTRVEQPAGGSDKAAADVYVAVALDHVESQVLHGENHGRHLTHVAVVVELKKIGKLRKGKSFDETVQLKLKPGTDPKNIRIIAFVQEPGPGRLLGAALRKPAS